MARAGIPGLKAVLFDMDGTILDSKQSIRETMNLVLAEAGQPTFTMAELDALIGRPLREILAEKAAPGLVERLAHRYRAAYNEVGWVTVRIFPGLLELLDDLRAAGLAIGVVTSKGQHETETVLFDLGIAARFDAVVGDDDQRPLKPDPAPVQEAARLLGTVPEACAMVGDTRFDIESGVRAGAAAVGVLWGQQDATTLRAAGAHHLVRDAAGLRRLLLG